MDGLTAWLARPPTTQGLDHLGTQAPCISLYSRLLPGITNVTDRARYYSLYPWLIWKFDQRFKTASPKDFETFYRRADCLLTLVAERHTRCAQEAGAQHGAAMIGRLTLLPALDRLEAGESLRLSTYATSDQDTGTRYFKNRLSGLPRSKGWRGPRFHAKGESFMKPNAEDFRERLSKMLASAEQLGFRAVEVKAGDLHRRVGGYPGTDHRMPICCNVLRQAMKAGDTVIEQPRSGQGASLVVRYCLPR